MRRKWCGLLLGLFMLLHASSGFGEEESITIAGATLRLGMSKEEVELRLQATGLTLGELDLRGSFANFGIHPLNPKQGESPGLFGSVTFAEEKLTHIWKDWGQFQDDEAATLAEALARAVLSANIEGQASATVMAQPVQALGKGEQAQGFIIRFDKKEISVHVSRSQRVGSLTSIHEGFARQPAPVPAIRSPHSESILASLTWAEFSQTQTYQKLPLQEKQRILRRHREIFPADATLPPQPSDEDCRESAKGNRPQ